MNPHRTAAIADVIRAVLSSDGAAQLSAVHASLAVDLALRKVIGMNCLAGNRLDIDLGNGHVLHCSLGVALQGEGT